MKKISILAAAALLFLILPAFAEVCATMPPAEEQQEGKDIPLGFVNSSGSEIKAIFLSQSGRDVWSQNLLKDGPLKNGEQVDLDIKRESILGLSDIKIIYSSGEEKLWKKLPILEIFEITNKKDGEPGYERIKLGA